MTRGRNVAIALGLTALGALTVAFGGAGPEMRGKGVLSVASTASGTPEGVISADRTRNIMFETLTAPDRDETSR